MRLHRTENCVVVYIQLSRVSDKMPVPLPSSRLINCLHPHDLSKIALNVTAIAIWTVAPILISFCTVAAAQENRCAGDETRLIEKRAGTQTGRVSFNYQSRVERYTLAAKRYIWCITNTSKYLVAEFRWGADADMNKDSRYFQSIIEPNKPTSAIRTDSSDVKIGLRYIGVRRLNSNHWKTIPVETIFNSHIGRSNDWIDLAPRNSIERTQLPVSPTNDFAKLSYNHVEFAAFIKKLGYVRFENSIIATIPTNLKTAKAIESDNYTKYDPSDFIRAHVTLQNYIEPTDKVPISNIYFTIYPENPDDKARLEQALDTIHGQFRLRPIQDLSGVVIPKALYVQALAVEQNKRVILKQPAIDLVYISASLSIGSAKYKTEYASLPVKLLISQTKRK
jgi:hypothetical protein